MFQCFRSRDFALPQDENGPSSALEEIDVFNIPLDVSVELVVPECAVGSGSCTARTIVLMPEAAVYEYDLFPSREDEVRCSRKVAPVQPISKPEPMDGSSDLHFRLGIALAHARH